MRRIALTAIVFAMLAPLLPAHADDAHADLAVRRVTPSTRAAHDGDRVSFRVVGQDLGPSGVDSSIDIAFVAYDRPHPQPPRNLRILRVDCYTHGFGTPPDVSSDGAVCEFGAVPAGTKVWMKVVARIERTAAGPPDRATIRFCASNESGVADPDPTDDCRRAHVAID